MEKVFRFINDHPYIIINVVGIIVIFLCLSPNITTWLGFMLCLLTYGFIHIPLYGLFLKIVGFEYCEAAIVIFFALILLALNISAFICIKKDKNIANRKPLVPAHTRAVPNLKDKGEMRDEENRFGLDSGSAAVGAAFQRWRRRSRGG